VLSNGRTTEALAVAETTVKDHPEAAEPMRLLYHLLRELHGAETAEQRLLQLAEANAKTCTPYLVLGQYREHDDAAAATGYYERGLGRDPRHQPLIAALTANLGARGEYPQIIERFDAMVSEGYLMEFAIYQNVAEAHAAQGNRSRVIAIYNERIHRGPEMHKLMAKQKLAEFKTRALQQAGG
jgi:tetratricopeptide (TPR) repeat protein